MSGLRRRSAQTAATGLPTGCGRVNHAVRARLVCSCGFLQIHHKHSMEGMFRGDFSRVYIRAACPNPPALRHLPDSSFPSLPHRAEPSPGVIAARSLLFSSRPCWALPVSITTLPVVDQIVRFGDRLAAPDAEQIELISIDLCSEPSGPQRLQCRRDCFVSWQYGADFEDDFVPLDRIGGHWSERFQQFRLGLQESDPIFQHPSDLGNRRLRHLTNQHPSRDCL